MKFCTNCGSSLGRENQFCSGCGAVINRSEKISEPVQKKQNTSALRVEEVVRMGKNNKQLTIAGLILIIGVIIYIMIPKKLTEAEYEQLALDLLVKDVAIQEQFSRSIENSSIDTNMEWDSEFKQLTKPAERAQGEFEDIYKELKGVKPPEMFEHDHQLLLKAFHIHSELMIGAGEYFKSGNEEELENAEEYQSEAEDYLAQTSFSSGIYKERLIKRIEKLGIE
ncbi:zinc ribbon domain-containing protein [Priestia flexa]|uniref:zinc ribbon domain-containing protein n=1 Tax=Priestia flexa TaxID=86664 RepID=UPI001B31E6F3|nr:zinc ribbon domain-containing protein [Priestia flexa]